MLPNKPIEQMSKKEYTDFAVRYTISNKIKNMTHEEVVNLFVKLTELIENGDQQVLDLTKKVREMNPTEYAEFVKENQNEQ